jgi:DUF4097 and DUF4098 domain-containing protein YvlB
MRSKAMIAGVAGALLLLCACDIEDWDVGQRRSQDFHHNYPLDARGRVSVEGFNGSVEISGWNQNAVDISGTKTAPSDSMLDALKIDIQHSGDSVSIRAIRPSGSHGNLGVKFVIRVPRQAQLDRVTSSNGAIRAFDVEGPVRLRTSNGSIRAENLTGSLDAQTSNASIEALHVAGGASLHTSNGRVHAEDVRGSFEATTSNSGVNARLGKLEPGKTVRVETSNGGVDLTLPPLDRNDVRVSTNNSGITLHLPGQVNARVMARTSNASINTDLEVRQEGEIRKGRLEGTIGSGGPLLDLSTSNGGIRLVRM